MNILLRDDAFKQLRDFICEKSGIFVPDTKKYFIENRLAGRVQENNLNSFEDYIYFVKYGTNGNEFARLIDAVTTNETFFFRESRHFGVFFDFIIPELTGNKGKSALKVWSAACSTGEEPYTIMMMHLEKKTLTRMDVFASDISEGVLHSARKAVYKSYSVRNVPEPYLRKYFGINGGDYDLVDQVKNAVRFVNINLMDEKNMKTMNDMDIIFCRNVLIYFDDKAKQKVVSHLYNSLRPGGFLIVGSTESLHNITRAFKPVIVNGVIVYRRT